jgi:hypothetical protein
LLENCHNSEQMKGNFRTVSAPLCLPARRLYRPMTIVQARFPPGRRASINTQQQKHALPIRWISQRPYFRVHTQLAALPRISGFGTYGSQSFFFSRSEGLSPHNLSPPQRLLKSFPHDWHIRPTSPGLSALYISVYIYFFIFFFAIHCQSLLLQILFHSRCSGAPE